MNQALQIGPLSLPYSVLLTLFAIALGGFVARRLARAAGTEYGSDSGPICKAWFMSSLPRRALLAQTAAARTGRP